ncbi:MAG: molybdate ABC transporter permease subunit [Candidatus Tectomicrobia bacterium]|uniref:Molybdenum transport system permease n=1 Tax=Tectimicrobiota bacterium TaxID=2528274 RepID=A0A933LQX8_UNCTE|nr:molybdate ABC transporter permease subunit [Candidatus Tectomicrobia bacterium]
MEEIWFPLKLSLWVSGLATIVVGISGIFFAYLFATKKFVGKNILDAFLTIPIILPPTVIGYFLLVIFGRNGFLGSLLLKTTGISLIFNWKAAVLAAVVVSFPLMYKTSKAAIESVDRDFLHASYTLGHSQMGTFFRIVLPLARKGIVAGLILSFARSMGEFGATLMIAGNIPGKTETMPLAIYTATNSGHDLQANILVAILTGASILVLYLIQKQGAIVGR